MIYFKIFDYLTIAALGFMSYGVLKQWYHIYKTKSAKDIITQEVIIRFIVTLVLWIKILLVRDKYLIIGQTIFLTAIIIYTFTLIKVKKTNK